MRFLCALWATLVLVCGTLSTPALAAVSRPVAFIPLDDRPVTLQLPVMLGEIAGQPVLTPPLQSLGHYLTPGDPDAILKWLRSSETQDVSAIVASIDMVGYGGLVASRVPGERDYVAYYRLRQLADAASARAGVPTAVFGTVMRLAPTGVPRIPETSSYWATGDTVDLIADYAHLPADHKTDEQIGKAERLRERIGAATLGAYLGARRRNLNVDEFALQLVAEGRFESIVLGQDDAGPAGLHILDLAALNATASRFGLDTHASIEPGADELGMVLLANAFARNAGWKPSIRVRYSRPAAPQVIDQLEYVPIDVTIDKLIHAAGAHRTDDPSADINLFVHVSGGNAGEDASFADAIATDVKQQRSVAVADISFLNGDPPSAGQQVVTQALIQRGIAGKIDAFASWNTNANTVGTAIATAIASGAGRRNGTYDERAHAQFLLDRYADDYAFHQFVRPVLNGDLRARGIDPTLLVPPVSGEASDVNRALLWPKALQLLSTIFPQYRDAGLTITLPWQRTFETRLDVGLKRRPRLEI